MKKDIGTKLYNTSIIKILITACFVFAFLFGIYGLIVSPEMTLFDGHASEYDRDWFYQKEDGSIETFKMPHNLGIEKGVPVTVYTMLPDKIDDDEYFCFLSSRFFTVYIDDVEIYTFDNSNKAIPGDVVKAIYVPVKLKSSYAGKKMTIYRYDPNGVLGDFNKCYIGNLLGIVSIPVKNQMLQYASALVLIVFSIFTIIVFMGLAKKNKKSLPLIYLAEGILAISIWIIFDSTLFQFAFGKYYIDGYIGYMLAILIPAPFLKYFVAIRDGRNKKQFDIYLFLIAINYIVLTALHFSNILRYADALIYINGCTVIFILSILYFSAKDYFVYKLREHKYVYLGLLGLVVFSLGEILFLLFKSATHLAIDTDGMIIIFGMYILLGCAVFDQIRALIRIQDVSREALLKTKAKSEFLANMSHEIRTPINAIMGMNEMILRESNEESIKEYASDIKGASENLLEIVNDILDFSKIESGMLEIMHDEYKLGELINDVVTMINVRAENKGLRLKILINPELPSVLLGDDKRIREVLINILNNAVKYTENGEIRLKLDGDKDKETINLTFSITDTGQGIREEDLDKIFSGFERVDNKKNKNIEGTGLGLSITKNLVELMGGEISVSSVYGEGSTFTVKLPQMVINDERIGDYRKYRQVSSDETSAVENIEKVQGASVLVVDDMPLNLKVIAKLLERNRMKVVCVESGQEALDEMVKEHFDIILLDHRMPNMDGVETLERAHYLDGNKCQDTPIIALTANAIVGAKEYYIENGFTDYISKPVEPRVLDEILVKYI